MLKLSVTLSDNEKTAQWCGFDFRPRIRRYVVVVARLPCKQQARVRFLVPALYATLVKRSSHLAHAGNQGFKSSMLILVVGS